MNTISYKRIAARIIPTAFVMAAIAAGGAALGSCQDSYDAPELNVPVATLQPNTTISEFKRAFGDEIAVRIPYKEEDSKTPYILHGRVVSSDASGNIYKSLVIQDETAAIALSINQSSMYTDYRLGQEVVLDATGLWAGQYASYVQIGALGEYNGNPQLGFMPYDLFREHSQLNGLPDQDFKYIRYGAEAPADKPYCTIISLADLLSIPSYGAPYLDMMSRLVEIPNVSFVDAGQTPPATFSTYQETTDRYITDASNNQLNVRCSGYSSFYNEPLPEGSGTVRGILSRYNGSWQLLLRGMEDVIFSSEGSKSEPYTVEQAIAMNNNGRFCWVEGRIVGSVPLGISEITERDQIIFNAADTETDNNVVIATSADAPLSEMMLVNLPAGSKIREYVNLLDNPQAVGKKLKVQGSLNAWLGMPAVTDVADGFSDFELEGLDISGVTDAGSGTADDPYTVSYIINNPEPQENVWIEGYIVGFVQGRSFDTGATFRPWADGDDYAGANMIIGLDRSTDSADASIPVQLSGEFRRQYGLKANPDKLGRRVKILCNVGELFGVYGILSISQIIELE